MTVKTTTATIQSLTEVCNSEHDRQAISGCKWCATSVHPWSIPAKLHSIRKFYPKISYKRCHYIQLVIIAQRFLLIPENHPTPWRCVLKRRLRRSWPIFPKQKSIRRVFSNTSWSESTVKKKETILRWTSWGDTLGPSTTVSQLLMSFWSVLDCVILKCFRQQKKSLNHPPNPT